MGQKFVITEEDRNRIRGLYEQTAPSQVKQPFNLFTYRDTISNIINSMTSVMENKPVAQVCQSLDNEMKPTYGLVDDLLTKMAADSGASEGEAVKYVYDTWKQQKTGGIGLISKLIGMKPSVSKEMTDKLYAYIRTKPNGGLLNSIVSDIFGTLNVQSIPMCGQQTKPLQ